jgi:inner membrane protein
VPIDPDGIVIQEPWVPLAFRTAALVCAIGVLAHVLLDLASGVGVQLLWPFYTRWFGWPLAPEFDPWIVLLLGVALILPLLFKLVNEEVGERRKGSGRISAAIALVLVAVYLCARGELHSRAIDLLLAREYRGEISLAAGAFPAASNPFVWRGLAVTDNTIEEVEVNAGPGADFDADRGVTHFKPGDSPALDAAENTATARRFLRYAKFPLASVARREAGYRVEIRDLRFASGDARAENIVARVDLDSDARVTAQALRFASDENP